jgi:hypothetical protein
VKRQRCDRQERAAGQRLGFQEAHRIGVYGIIRAQRHIEFLLMILKGVKKYIVLVLMILKGLKGT